MKAAPEQRKRGRWDQTIDDQFVPAKKVAGSATPTWNDVEVSENSQGKIVGQIIINGSFLSIGRKHRLQSVDGMKHPDTKAVKHLVPHHVRNVCGMRLRLTLHRHRRMRRPPMRNRRDEIVGMRHRKRNVKPRVTILVGLKHRKQIVAQETAWFWMHRRQHRNDDRVGTRLQPMQRHRWEWRRAWRQAWHRMRRMQRHCSHPVDRRRLVTKQW